MKYIFITHRDVVEHPNDVELTYHCNYYKRVDELLEEYLVSKLADESPSEECSEFAKTIDHFSLVSRFNPQRDYRMSIVIFEEDQESIVTDLLQQIDEQHGPTIKMIRESGDTKKL